MTGRPGQVSRHREACCFRNSRAPDQPTSRRATATAAGDVRRPPLPPRRQLRLELGIQQTAMSAPMFFWRRALVAATVATIIPWPRTSCRQSSRAICIRDSTSLLVGLPIMRTGPRGRLIRRLRTPASCLPTPASAALGTLQFYASCARRLSRAHYYCAFSPLFTRA